MKINIDRIIVIIFQYFHCCGVNNRLPLLHMAKRFIWIHEKYELINGFDFVCMINPTFHVDKSFKEHVSKCMNNMFGSLKPTFI